MYKQASMVLFIALVAAPYLQAQLQLPYIGRFHEGQETERVVIPENLEAGRLQDGKLFLTEQQAIEMALANNLDININKHDKISSYWDIALQKASYDPEAFFNYDWHKTIKETSSILEGGEQLTDIMGTYALGYSQPFSTGTDVEVTFTGVRNETSNFFAGVNPSINTQFRAIVSQDLLKGFLKSQPEYEIEISLNNSRLTEESFREQATEIIVQVQESFWSLAAAGRVVETNRKALELARTVHEQNLIQLEVGTGSELETIQSEAEVSSREEELIRAEYNLRLAQDALVKMISSYEDPRQIRATIVPEGLDDINAQDFESFEQLMETASTNRPEIKQLDINISNLEIRAKQSMDDLKPSLSISGGYEQFGLGGVQIIRDFSGGFINPPVVEVIKGGLGNSLSDLFSGSYRGYVFGFDLRFPINNDAARARSAQASIDLNRARMEKRSVRQMIALEIRDALTQIKMNKARIAAADSTVKAAERRLEGEEARFEVGVGTTRELIEAQRDLVQAISTQVEAHTALAISLAMLDKAVGRTFDRHGIVVKDEIGRNVN